jgi:hypothetical protein
MSSTEITDIISTQYYRDRAICGALARCYNAPELCDGASLVDWSPISLVIVGGVVCRQKSSHLGNFHPTPFIGL